MSWLETADGRQLDAVHGKCATCGTLQLALSISLFGSKRERRHALGDLRDHMRDVVHLDGPPATPDDDFAGLLWWPKVWPVLLPSAKRLVAS